MVRTTTDDDRAKATTRSLENAAEYINDRTGNFGARVEDRNVHDGDDTVVVDVGSTGSVAQVIAIGASIGLEVRDVEVRDVEVRDGGPLQSVVFVPEDVAEWLRKPYRATAERHFEDVDGDGSIWQAANEADRRLAEDGRL